MTKKEKATIAALVELGVPYVMKVHMDRLKEIEKAKGALPVLDKRFLDRLKKRYLRNRNVRDRDIEVYTDEVKKDFVEFCEYVKSFKDSLNHVSRSKGSDSFHNLLRFYEADRDFVPFKEQRQKVLSGRTTWNEVFKNMKCAPGYERKFEPVGS